ncbi:cytochrome c oxidase subunit 2 [Faunimonas pinastri]|uniref:cytochrome-c oxidase n=1 Tax=Faunimonas pinastri TaxID=1855383 RepID=A0A1H9LVG7_9HYPH|nr:cytochrome c oxidase subunit II [Faunimonas pinastri]SER14833.1 cytochrome c oxidase subunit 2 [Faunimonas pinastri]
MNDFLPTETVGSQAASATDHLFYALLGISVAVVLLVSGLILVFSIRYRRGSKADRSELPPILQREVEIGWTLATLFLFLSIFGWAVSENFSFGTVPTNGLEIHVVAKQWMWKLQHPGGQREINALHVPVNKPVRLIMNSEDVIHSFYVPSFRLKQDVVPGLTTQLVFTPIKVGTFRLLCAEYCGTDHSAMTGKIVVMTPEDYSRWLDTSPASEDLVAQGRDIFTRLGCAGCHDARAAVRAPDLKGVFGQPVPLADGTVVQADETYLRDSILQPRKQIVAGFDPVMPSFAGRLSDAELETVIAYLKSLADTDGDTR